MFKKNKSNQSVTLIAAGHNNSNYEFEVRDNYEIFYKKKKINFEILEEPDGFSILSGNGVRYPVEVLASKQNTYDFLINGVGYSFSVETPFSLRRKEMLANQECTVKKESIKAPMPGKILEIMAIVGQTVAQGEALVILEAMKMQNILTSGIKGKVVKVAVKQGDNVAKDDILIEIERT